MKSEYQGETLWLTHITEAGTIYRVTSDEYRKEYHLWKEDKKTKYTASDPTDLYKYCK